MLRAAYFGQELLSTFSTTIGEVALIPATGGVFTVVLTHESGPAQGEAGQVHEVLLWDRKSEGGFPETKVLKQRFRDHVEPDRDLGHSDRKKHVSGGSDKTEAETTGQTASTSTQGQDVGQEAKKPVGTGADCEDCK